MARLLRRFCNKVLPGFYTSVNSVLNSEALKYPSYPNIEQKIAEVIPRWAAGMRPKSTSDFYKDYQKRTLDVRMSFRVCGKAATPLALKP